MANGYPIIPSPLRVRGLAGDQQRGLSQLPPTYLGSRAGVPSYTQLPQRVGESVMPSAVLTPQQRAARATANLAKLTQSRGGGSDVMPVTQQRPRGFFDSLPSPMSPAGQGLTAAATTGLQLSGWQDRPITLGSALAAMGQAGMEAYTAAQEREAAAKIDEENLYLNRLKAEAALAKAQGDGGFFAGKSSFAQTGNTLISLAPKIKSGKATPDEIAQYTFAYSTTQKPQKITSYDSEGNATITEIPAQDLPEDMFPRPAGMREPATTVKPSAETLKQAYKVKDSLKMLQNLNRYRSTLQDPEFTVSRQIGGIMGFPRGKAAIAGSQATSLRMDLKQLYELGALVGGDFQILDSLLTNPNSPEAIGTGREGLLAQLDQLERQLEQDMAIKGVELFGTLANPIVAESKEDYDNAPNNTYVLLPDGRTVLKGVK